MPTTTEGLYGALLSLSGNPALVEARGHLLSCTSGADLQKLVNYSTGDEMLRRNAKISS
jgi:hypothetical protein